MIKTIELEGYRLLDDFKADLGPLTVVIGANATGKSTLINYVGFVSRCVRYPLNVAVSVEGGIRSLFSASRETSKLNWRLTFRKPEDHPFWKKVPLKGDRYYVYEVTIGADQYDQPVAEYETLRTEKPYGGHDEPLKLLEATRYKSLIYNAAEHRLVPFDELAGENAQGLFGDLLQKEKQPPSETQTPDEVSAQKSLLRLARMQFYNEYPIPSWTRSLIGNYSVYLGFEVGRGSKLRTQPAEILPHTVLSSEGENLGTVLHEILTRAAYRASAEEMREFLRVAYPSFDDIYAETTFGTPPRTMVKIREKGLIREMNLWESSDGMLRFLCLSAALLNPIPPAFIAIDEPEVGLHPRLLPIVADMIKTASERTQVFITTHSPDLLNCFDIDDVAVMAREENRIEWKRPGNRTTLKKMLETVTGETLGDLHRSGELEAL